MGVGGLNPVDTSMHNDQVERINLSFQNANGRQDFDKSP
jgi:hypothetical protein